MQCPQSLVRQKPVNITFQAVLFAYDFFDISASTQYDPVQFIIQ